MNSNVDSFSIRSTNRIELSLAMSYAYASFIATTAKATNTKQFHEAARSAGVSRLLEQDTNRMLDFVVDSGYIFAGKENDFREAVNCNTIASNVKTAAEAVSNIAVAVIVHAALERFLWAMCRIGSAVNRPFAMKLIGEKTIKVSQLERLGKDACIDECIESWLTKLDRDSCLEKWDKFIGFFGSPKDLITLPNWTFTRDMLEAFDKARHDAVHDSGTTLRQFDLETFNTQLYRAVLILVTQAHRSFNLSLFPQAFMGTAALDAIAIGILKSVNQPTSDGGANADCPTPTSVPHTLPTSPERPPSAANTAPPSSLRSS